MVTNTFIVSAYPLTSALSHTKMVPNITLSLQLFRLPLILFFIIINITMTLDPLP